MSPHLHFFHPVPRHLVSFSLEFLQLAPTCLPYPSLPLLSILSKLFGAMPHQFSSVQLLNHVRVFVTPWTAALQTSLSITNCQSLSKPMSIESVMPFNHLTLCRPLLLLPPIPPSIRVFSNEWALCIRWPKYWNFSFNISPSNEHPGLICFRKDWLDLLAAQGALGAGVADATAQE